jgi:hypothetical protein
VRGAVPACLLLALAACGGGAAQSNGSGTASAPSPTTGAPSRDPEPDGTGPRNSFIVCPGNPRCPPEGSQPKGREGN